MKLKNLLFIALLTTVAAVLLLTVVLPPPAEAAGKTYYWEVCSTDGTLDCCQWAVNLSRTDAQRLCGTDNWCSSGLVVYSVSKNGTGHNLCH